MGPNQTKELLNSKGINKMKRQHTEWEKIFANDSLISKIYKQLIQFSIKKHQITQLKNEQKI